jgi:hypothetical protein
VKKYHPNNIGGSWKERIGRIAGRAKCSCSWIFTRSIGVTTSEMSRASVGEAFHSQLATAQRASHIFDKK